LNPLHFTDVALYLNRRLLYYFLGQLSVTKRQYQDTASIREPGRRRPEFCDEPVDQTSRDPKLVARRNHKFFSHFRLIWIWRSVKGDESPPHALARVPNPRREADCHWETMPESQKQSLAHKSSAVVYDLRAIDGLKPNGYAEGNGITHVNILRTIEAMYGLPKSGAQLASSVPLLPRSYLALQAF